VHYPRVRAQHGLSEEEMRAFVEAFADVAEVVHPETVDPGAAIPADVDDNPILAAAVVGGARVLCTLDRHFSHPEVLAYCRDRGIEVLSDVELLRRLRRDDQPNA
jgi:predicted nucleic acid-binding protein